MHLAPFLIAATSLLASLTSAMPAAATRPKYGPRSAVDLELGLPKPTELTRLFDLSGIEARTEYRLLRKGANLARNIRRRYRKQFPSGNIPANIKAQAKAEFDQGFELEITNARQEQARQLEAERAKEQAVNEKLSDADLREKLLEKTRVLEAMEKDLCQRSASRKYLEHCEDVMPRYREQVEALEDLLERRKKGEVPLAGGKAAEGSDSGRDRTPEKVQGETRASPAFSKESVSLAGQPSKLVLDGLRGLAGGGAAAGGIEGLRRLIPGLGFGIPESILNI